MRVYLRTRVLAELMAKAHMTQADLASRAGISQSYVSRLLAQSRHPGPRTRRALLEALGLEFDDLFTTRPPTRRRKNGSRASP